MRLWRAFLRRDWLIRSSYRIGLVAWAGHVLFTIAVFFFISRLIDPHRSPLLGPYGGAYFPFVLLGLAFSRYVTASLSSLAGNLRDEQLQGTLEAMLASPVRLSAIAIGSVLPEFVWATVEVGAYLLLGALVFGVDLGRMNAPAAAVVLILSLIALSSLGLLSASGILLFKELDPVSWMLGGVMKLAGGVYFPVALLPAWLGWLAKCVPLTYALEGLRQAVLLGTPLGDLAGVCLALILFSLALWPLALGIFAWTIRRLKITGSLSFR